MSLPFEKPIEDLEAKIRDMRAYAAEQEIDLASEVEALQDRLDRLKRDTYENLTRWQRVQVARAAGRPTGLDYLQRTFDDFTELHGDRTLGDDPAVVTGLARLAGTSVIVIAQQKGRDTKENIHRNFGMSHPSGYRKAMRMFDLADKFRLPVIALIDTPGAYPGLAAEEQGQAWVIAESIRRMSQLTVPAISVVIGEGGSGGALAIGVANRVLILENAIYSVISPESCAAILWRDAGEAEKAAEALRLTARDLIALEIVDRVVDEPLGGAHNDPDGAMALVKQALVEELAFLASMSPEQLLESRYKRFRVLGRFQAVAAA
ncbi:MAG: acetyl-CoA carboxylase carboxyltransferase subunit alpha [Trueperaceae bacterium]|nr:acetyl-CoA carboxylase carboxyltransferase subunit alpha [Trueperaceae bacterium]MCC6311410.1 acetyl-CoA carboxylase carboxyltransferase subunit alpha [Trueperaceae bacterium]MCW5820290.1 acetyl-CoA carboxylase carboxyltransferase subunit alpha [Trueperaceae bacterium]